jgi:NAD(P)-dependent dehydrogenase (short-subunit alcohol dehydrogenase family)
LTAPHPDRGWALVTGAARRIGRALALGAAQAGFDVVVHYGTSKADAAETAGLITKVGRRAKMAAADLRDPTSTSALIGAAEGPLTLVVSSASIFEDDKIETVSAESVDAHMAVNLRAPVMLARAFAEALPADRTGLIVNILDQRVWRLTPQFFSYTLSKAALWTATRTMAQALGPQIRVNAIGPGPTLPSIHQSAAQFAAEGAASLLGRGPTPEDVAAALTYLIDASSVTGQMIAVDGGQHLAWRTPDVIGD